MVRTLVISASIVGVFGAMIAFAQQADTQQPLLVVRAYNNLLSPLPGNPSAADQAKVILDRIESRAGYFWPNGNTSIPFDVMAEYGPFERQKYAVVVNDFARSTTYFNRDTIDEFSGICQRLYDREVANIASVSAVIGLKITAAPIRKGSIVSARDGNDRLVVVEGLPCSAQGDVIRVELAFAVDRADYEAFRRDGPQPSTAIAAPTAAPQRKPLVVLRSTRAGDPPAAPPPARKVYKPGERPEPPTPPALQPCPAGKVCATQEGGPLTAEAIAYERQLRDYNKALAAYEADEAAKRAAGEEENRKVRAAYDEQQRLARERQAALDAQRQAKIDADNAAYAAQLRAHQAEVDRLASEHAAKMEDWRRRVAACQAGDKSQCQQ